MSFSQTWAFGIATIAALIPAAILALYSQKKYMMLMEERKQYLIMGIGLLVGVVLAIFHSWAISEYVIPFLQGGIMWAIILGVLFSFTEILIRVAILNLKKFRGDSKITFYGPSLALMGTMVAGLKVYTYLKKADLYREIIDPGNETINATLKMVTADEHYTVWGVLLFCVACAFFYTAIGIVAGHACSQKKVRNWTIIGALFSIPFYSLTFIWYLGGGVEGGDFFVLLAVCYAVVLFYVTQTKLMPQAHPDFIDPHKIRQKKEPRKREGNIQSVKNKRKQRR